MATAEVEVQQPKTEPKVRKNGKCYVCRGERPPIAHRNLDPFCSSDCCKLYYTVKRST